MVIAGSFFVRKTLRIIRTVAVIPSPSVSGSKDLILRIETASIIPGLHSKPLLIPSNSITTSAKLFVPAKQMSMADRVADQRRRQQEQEYLETRRLTLPFRQAAYWIRRAFSNLQGVLFDETFLSLKLKGRSGALKMDRNPAWALDEGRAFDALVQHDRDNGG
ncbi:hypothetical protein MMC10_007787 [Thelotrema lepadinum]|nr:hypothetical protein [Thelotrema lepadinum]